MMYEMQGADYQKATIEQLGQVIKILDAAHGDELLLHINNHIIDWMAGAITWEFTMEDFPDGNDRLILHLLDVLAKAERNS